MNDTYLPAGAARGVAPLLLRLVRSLGSAREGTLPIFAPGAGLADALELGGERLDEAQRREADLCRIHWQGRHWQLSSASDALVCALNGERMSPGMAVPVASGDTLELGLLRFAVEVEATDAAFDLRDLALPVPEGQRAEGDESRSTHLFDDPFGVLDVAGARSRPAADPLAELLGELPPRASEKESRHSNPASAAVEDDKEPKRKGESAVALHSAHALIDGLHEEFVRVVRDPTQLTSGDWSTSAATDGEYAPSMAELSRDAKRYLAPLDILRSREHIDQVIERFDPLGGPTLLDRATPEEVLRLFAPELRHGVTLAVPSLTRREHHALSPDSHMPMAHARPAGKEAE